MVPCRLPLDWGQRLCQALRPSQVKAGVRKLVRCVGRERLKYRLSPRLPGDRLRGNDQLESGMADRIRGGWSRDRVGERGNGCHADGTIQTA